MIIESAQQRFSAKNEWFLEVGGKGGWFWRSRRFQIPKIMSSIDSAPQNYYMDRSKSILEQKNFQLLKNFNAFLFLRQVTATFQNGQNWKFFFPKCSPGFNELGGIGFRAVFVITKPPEALKFEISAILSIFMDFFYDTLRGHPKLMKFQFFLYKNVAKASN